MGLASKLGPAPAASAPPMPGGQTGPPGYPQVGAPSAPSMNQSSPYGLPQGGSSTMGGPSQQNLGSQGQPGYPQVGQYGAPQPGQQGRPAQPGQYGQPGQMGGQQGQFGAQQGQYGAPQQQQSQYGAQQGQFGSQQGQFGAQQGQFGAQQGQFGQQQGQYGQPGQFGGQQGQFGQPQGQFGQQPGMQQGFGGGPFSKPMVLQKLQKLVMDNRLQAFYPPQKLDQVAAFVASKDVEGLGQRWRLPREVTADLMGLALYDICIYVDDSGSMAFEEGGERIDDMKAVLGRTADAATLFDTDGIVVRFMNSTVEGNGIHSEAEAANLIQQIRFSGTTPLGTALDRKVLQPMVLSQARSNSMQKPVLVICITDGEPTGEPKETVRQVVLNAKNQLQNTPYGSGAVAFQFAQVGKDAAATRFLSALDVDPVIGSMIDCTSYYEQEQEEYARKGINLDPSLYLVKLMVGGFDRSYDEGDEG